MHGSYPYGYVEGANGIGIGAGDKGFKRPSTLPVDSIYAARYNVRGDLAPLNHPGYVKEAQQLVPVSLLANGVYFAGTMALQALAEFEKANR